MKIYRKWTFVIGVIIAAIGLSAFAYAAVVVKGASLTIISVEFLIFGVCIILNSFSFEATRSIYESYDERSKQVRQMARSTAFQLTIIPVTITIAMAKFLFSSEVGEIVAISLLGVYTVMWLFDAILLIYYDRRS